MVVVAIVVVVTVTVVLVVEVGTLPQKAVARETSERISVAVCKPLLSEAETKVQSFTLAVVGQVAMKTCIPQGKVLPPRSPQAPSETVSVKQSR